MNRNSIDGPSQAAENNGFVGHGFSDVPYVQSMRAALEDAEKPLFREGIALAVLQAAQNQRGFRR